MCIDGRMSWLGELHSYNQKSNELSRVIKICENAHIKDSSKAGDNSCFFLLLDDIVKEKRKDHSIVKLYKDLNDE